MDIRFSPRTLAALCVWLAFLSVPQASAQRYGSDGSVIPDAAQSPDDSSQPPALSPDDSSQPPALSPDDSSQPPALAPEDSDAPAARSAEDSQGGPVLSPDAVRPDPARPAD